MLMSDLIRYPIYLAVHSFNSITMKILFLLFEYLILEAAPSENDRRNAKRTSNGRLSKQV